MMKRIFVNRISELRHLNRALKDDGKETPVLVFTGIGGMGKTALRTAFEEQILKPNKIPYAVLDYDGDPNLRPIEATLRAIRRQLGRHGITTPVFDYLFARYFELSTGVKLSAHNYPLELEGVVNILEGIPIVSNITQVLYGLSQLGLKVKERVQHKEWLYRIRDLEPFEVLNLLPEVLAEDLEETMSSQTPEVLKLSGCRVALLLDAYEHLSESHLDDTHHRKFLLLTPHLFRVIFTRDPLPWEHKFPVEWRDKVIHFPALDDLSRQDARAFLQEKNIEDPNLQEHLYQLTGGYPLHLELCTDIYREIEVATNRKAQIKDFEGAAQAKNLTDELMHRLLRQLKDDERDLMRLAVYPRWFSEGILEVLSSVPESVPRIFKKFIELSIISLHPEIPEAYVIRKEVRESLLAQQRKEPSWTRQHRKLAIFHRERWHDTELFQHLREALYHGCYEDSASAMKMFEEHFWKLLNKFSFAEADGFLEAIPLDTLSEQQKRKANYARASLLTARAQSQESLITAKHLYEALVASEIDEESLGAYFFHLGELLCSMGEYERALECLRKSLAIRLQVLGEAHPDVAESYNDIGEAYSFKGEHGMALEYYQKSLTLWLKVYGEGHPRVAVSYNNIGLVYKNKGEYEKALEYYQKAFVIRLKVFGEEHPEVAGSYNNIGIVCLRKGEYGKALEYHEKALAIKLKVFGEEHPDVAVSYNNIGIVYLHKSEYGKALEYHEKAFAIKLKVFGEEHPEVATSYNNIGNVYQDLGKYEKALEYYQKDLTIKLKVFGEEHPDVATSYNNIGNIYARKGEYGKALEYHEKGLTIRLQVFGEDHPDVTVSYSNIGLLYHDLGENERALEYHEKVLTSRLKVFGEEHPKVALSYSSIGIVYHDLGENEKALEYHEKALTIWLKVHGEEHPDVAYTYNNIGIVYHDLGENEKALEYHEKALTIRMKIFEEDHPDVAESHKEIAHTLWALKREDEASAKIKQSAEIYRKFHLWKDAVEVLETLAGWLEEMGKKEESEEALKEAKRIRKEHNVP